MSVQDRQKKRYYEKYPRQPGRKLNQHIRGLRSEQVFRHSSAKSGTKALALRALHQNNKHHQQRHDDPEREQNRDQNGHWEGEYGRAEQLSNR